MDYRNLFGIGFILLSVGYVIRSLQPANASMPVGMQHGQFPYESLSTTDGSIPTVPNQVPLDVITVPSDRLFILTAFKSSSYCRLYVDGTLKRESFFYSGSTSHLVVDNAHVVLQPGEVLQVYNVSSSYSCIIYHLEGYYAHL